MIGVTGASGYVGSRILSHLRANGAEAVALVRSPATDDDHARRYALGEPLAAETLADVELVVHAAYDIAERGGRVILVSSLAAFEGVRTDYGRAKLELERAVLERGGIALRAGVV